MSTYEQKLVAPTVRLPDSGVNTLAEDLRRIGVPPLSSSFVAACMERAALRLEPETKVWPLRLKRMFCRPESWVVMSLAKYLAHGNIQARNGHLPSLGWPMPPDVLTQARLAETLPGTSISVHALVSDDPWVFVERGQEVEPIAGWYGRDKQLRVFLG